MFEVKDTFDLLKGLINILTEYEQIKDDPIDKPKMVSCIFCWPNLLPAYPQLSQRIFRTKLNKKQGLGEYAMSYSDASETSYLITPPMVCLLHPKIVKLLPLTLRCSLSLWITSKP